LYIFLPGFLNIKLGNKNPLNCFENVNVLSLTPFAGWLFKSKMNNFFPYTDNFLNSGSFLLLSMASRLLSPEYSFEAQPVR